jgi:hypothetical protein
MTRKKACPAPRRKAEAKPKHLCIGADEFPCDLKTPVRRPGGRCDECKALVRKLKQDDDQEDALEGTHYDANHASVDLHGEAMVNYLIKMVK